MMTRNGRKDAVMVPVFIITGKLIAFIFNALLGFYYGAGKISDAFIMAHTIPTILFEGVATALISCYIPIYSSLKYESPDRIKTFNSNLFNLSTILAVIITIVYYIYHHSFNTLYAKGFDVVSMALLDGYTSIIVWSIPFIGAYSIFRAHLQVSGNRAISSIGQSLTYFVLVISIIGLYPNDKGMAWATLLGNIICFIVFAWFAFKTDFSYRFYLSLREDYIRTLFMMLFPIFFSTIASELASIVDKFFASQYSDGIITSLTYGYQLSFAMQGIISASLLIIVFPSLSAAAARFDYKAMNALLYKCIEIIGWLVTPLVVGGMVLASPIIELVLGHGRFDKESVAITASIFSLYLLGVLPMCIKHVGDKTCYAIKKTRFAMVTTFVTVGINIILDYYMSLMWGYMGLVWATGIAILIGCAVSFVLIKKENDSFSLIRIISCLARPLFSSALMGLVVFALRDFLYASHSYDLNVLLKLFTCISVGGLVYVSVALILFKKNIYDLGFR